MNVKKRTSLSRRVEMLSTKRFEFLKALYLTEQSLKTKNAY